MGLFASVLGFLCFPVSIQSYLFLWHIVQMILVGRKSVFTYIGGLLLLTQYKAYIMSLVFMISARNCGSSVLNNYQGRGFLYFDDREICHEDKSGNVFRATSQQANKCQQNIKRS